MRRSSLAPASGRSDTNCGRSSCSIVAISPGSPPSIDALRIESSFHTAISPITAPGCTAIVMFGSRTLSVPLSSTPNHVPVSPFSTTVCSASKCITESASARAATSPELKPLKPWPHDWRNPMMSRICSHEISDCRWSFFSRMLSRATRIERREHRRRPRFGGAWSSSARRSSRVLLNATAGALAVPLRGSFIAALASRATTSRWRRAGGRGLPLPCVNGEMHTAFGALTEQLCCEDGGRSDAQ